VQVYQTSTTGFLRLLLGFAMLSSPLNEAAVLSVLLPPSSPASSTTADSATPLVAILDALEDLAKIQEQQRQARTMLLTNGGGAVVDGEDEVAETQVEEMQVDEMDEEGDETRGIRELVRRLRAKVEEKT
jgi:hypothetical protein